LIAPSLKFKGALMRTFGLFVLMASLLAGQSLLAGDKLLTFNKSTVVPVSVQDAIEGKYYKHCDYIWTRGWEATEIKTVSRYEPLDQTPTQQIFETTFAIRGFDNDGMHPFTTSMHVVSVVENPFSSEETVRVLKIDAKDNCQYQDGQ